jgi:hypothetical protein
MSRYETVRQPEPIKVLCIACGKPVEVPVLVVSTIGISVYVERPHCAKPAQERGDA